MTCSPRRRPCSIGPCRPDDWDVIEAAACPRTTLRCRNDALLEQLGIDPAAVSGFFYGQRRDRRSRLQDLGTKGSGTTP